MKNEAYPIEEIKKHIDDMNIEVKMFKSINRDKNPYGVRLRDLDANENISTTFCPTIDLAEKYYNEAIEG